MQSQLSEIEKSQLKIARVIINANNTEAILNKYIAEFYTKVPDGDYKEAYLAFLHDIVSQRYISLDSKIQILRNIFKKIDDSRRLKQVVPQGDIFEKWIKVRNKFAHGELMAYEGSERLLYNGEIFNIDSLAKEFGERNRKIMEVLGKYTELEGPYFNMFRAKKGRNV